MITPIQKSQPSAIKHYGILAVKLIAVPAGLVWLISKLLADTRMGNVPFDPWLLVAALIINQLALLLFALRMRMVLSAFDVALSLHQTIRIHLQSMFYFFVIPMTVGLEAARFAKIKEAAAGSAIPSTALGAALLSDRLIGAFAALIISVAMWPFVQFQLPVDWHFSTALLWLPAIGFVVVAAFLFSRFRPYILELTAQWRGRLGSLSRAFVVAIVVHAFFCFGIFLAATAIAIPIELHQTLFVVSAAMLFVVLPFSVAGAGPIEIANMAMLLTLGMSTEQAVAFTLLSYLARMVAAFEGGLWEIWEGGLMALSRFPIIREQKSAAFDQNQQADAVSAMTSKTISDFGEQWVNYRSNPGYYGSVNLLADICGPLLSLEDFRAARIADIGSGTGRIVNMLLDAEAKHVVALEPSAAYSVLRINTASRQNSITYINDRGESLPPSGDLDLVVSMGVIHHIPDPAPVMDAAYRALRPGGRILVWLYGFEGNETYLRFVEPLRAVAKRLPHRLLQGVCALLNLGLDIYIFLCRFIPLPMRVYARNVLARLPRRIRGLTIYDQLNPAYAKYYRREEAEALLLRAGFTDVRTYHRHGYSWTVIGSKPQR